MFKDLQSVFRRSWQAFQAELSRREPEDEVAELLSLMRREMVAARAALPEYDQAVEGARAELERERRALEDCQRRRGMAERIGDEETVRIAREFETKHLERAGVLEAKLRAAEAERTLRQSEAEEMVRRYKQADANRFGMVAELRRSRTREGIAGASAAFDDFVRAGETIENRAAYADALEELESDGIDGSRAAPDRAARASEVEERLRELKRRMGKE